MSRIAYRLSADKSIEEVRSCSWMEDVDEDFTSKKAYEKRAKELAQRFNKDMKTSFAWEELFGCPEDVGYRYCSKCDTYFWDGEECSCDW